METQIEIERWHFVYTVLVSDQNFNIDIKVSSHTKALHNLGKKSKTTNPRQIDIHSDSSKSYYHQIFICYYEVSKAKS